MTVPSRKCSYSQPLRSLNCLEEASGNPCSALVLPVFLLTSFPSPYGWHPVRALTVLPHDSTQDSTFWWSFCSQLPLYWVPAVLTLLEASCSLLDNTNKTNPAKGWARRHAGEEMSFVVGHRRGPSAQVRVLSLWALRLPTCVTEARAQVNALNPVLWFKCEMPSRSSCVYTLGSLANSSALEGYGEGEMGPS